MASQALSLPVSGTIWKLPTVSRATAKSRSTLYREIGKGLFVKPVQLGGNSVGWSADEVIAINRARIAGASDEAIKALVAELQAARVAA